jgi:hypothetical protein
MDDSEPAIAQKQAKWTVETTIRNLTGNLLRVIRGSGQASNLSEQVRAIFESLVQYQAAFGRLPPAEMFEAALAIDRDPGQLSDMDNEHRDKVEAHEAIVGAALRIAAARILDQKVQATAGEKDLDDGIRSLEEAGEAQGKKRQAKQIRSAGGRRIPKSSKPPRK